MYNFSDYLMEENQSKASALLALDFSIRQLNEQLNATERTTASRAIVAERNSLYFIQHSINADNYSDAYDMWQALNESVRDQLNIGKFLTEGGSGSGRPDEYTRKKKNLWFFNIDNWLADVYHTHISQDDEYVFLTNKNDNCINIYVVDPDTRERCFAFWDTKNRKGIVYYKSVPIKVVAGPIELIEINDIDVSITNFENVQNKKSI